MNHEVSKYLDYYLDEAPPGRGAVLLTGAWGAGKTFFIERYLAERQAKRKRADPLSGPAHLRVSLYGVRTPEELRDQFFAQTNPALSSGLARLLGTAGARAANILSGGNALKDEDGKALQRFLARDIKGIPLVFDDLERCAGSLHEIMGYINSFVEREGAKVVLVADEAKILAGPFGDDYLERKEKLIGKTLEVRTDPAEVYAPWAGELRHPAARAAAQKNEAAALRTFNASKINNLRSLRAVLEDFDRLTAAVDPRLGASAPAMSRLLTYMLATGVELRAGKLRADQLGSLSALRMERVMVGVSGRAMKPELKALADITGKYADVEWSDSVVPPACLAKLYTSGVIDRDVINAALAEHPLVAPPGEAPSWRRLWRWFEISPAEYQEVRADFLRDLASHVITHPGPILHAAGLIILLRNNEDDLLEGRDTPEFFAEYVQELEGLDRLEPVQAVLEGIDETGFAGLGYAEYESADFKAVREHLAAAVDRVADKRLREGAPSLLEQLRGGPDAYEALYEHGRGEGRFGAVAVLQHIDVPSFAALALPNGAPDDRLLGALHERFRRDHEGRLIRQEQGWLDALRDQLRTRADALPPPHRSRASKRLGYWWAEIDKTVQEAHAHSRMQSGRLSAELPAETAHADSAVALRPMTPEDLQEFEGWFPDPAEDYGVPEPAPDWIGSTDPAAWTALAGDAVVGFIQASRSDPATGEPLLDRARINIAVAPEKRGMGLGPSIIAAFAALPDTPPVLEALVSQDNDASRRCVAKAGFAPADHEPDEDGSILYVRLAP